MDGLTFGADQFSTAIHDGIITIENPATGGHRTFKIETQHSGNLSGKRIVSLLVGRDNTGDYQGFGFVVEDGRVVVWRKFRGIEKMSDFDKFASMLAAPRNWSEKRGLVYHVAGACRRCGRVLSTPESVRRGLGPTCAEKV